MRRLLAILALALPIGACASILGFDDVSLGEPPGAADADAAGRTSAGGDAQSDPSAAACDASVACGPCADGGCPQTPVLGDHYDVTSLSVDGNWLYITSFNDVLRVDKTTNVATSLVPDGASGGTGGAVSALALDGTNVYWAARFTDAFWCPSSGCPGTGDPFQVSPDNAQPLSIAVSGGLVLWVGYETAFLFAADKLDGGGVRQVSSTELRSPFLLADSSSAWIPDGLSNRVIRIDLDGGAATTLAHTTGTPLGIALVNGAIYFGDSSGGLGAVPALGGAPPVLFGAPTKRASAITSDATYLYWADQGSVDASNNRVKDGCIWRCALATCTTTLPTALACGLYAPTAIAVDDHWLYWSTLGPGAADELDLSAVTKVPKP